MLPQTLLLPKVARGWEQGGAGAVLQPLRRNRCLCLFWSWGPNTCPGGVPRGDPQPL